MSKTTLTTQIVPCNTERESRVGTPPEKSCNQSNETHSKHDKKKHKKVRPKPWKTHEKEAVSLHFASAIMLKRLSGKEVIVTFLEEKGINRSWKNVKDQTRNTYLS